MKQPDLSVVLLCYGEDREHISAMIKTIRHDLSRLHIQYEIILSANYNSAASRQSARSARGLRLPQNTKTIAGPKQAHHGLGWDVRQGLHQSKGKIVAIVEGDEQVDISLLSHLYQAMREQQYDMYKVYREARGDGFHRLVISRCYNLLFRLLWPSIKDRDINAKPKLIARQALDKMNLTSNDWFIDAEIMLQANRDHLRIGTLNTTFRKNSRRLSYVSLFTIYQFVINMIKYRVSSLRFEKSTGQWPRRKGAAERVS